MADEHALVCPQTTSEKPLLQAWPFASVALGTVSNTGHGPNNEDVAAAFVSDPQAGVIAVADGAGGLPAGAAASECIIDTINRAVRTLQNKHSQTLRETVIESILSANKKVINKKNGSGSTLALLLVEKNKVQPVFVGDSIIILTGQRGKIKYINFPHSPIGYLYRGGIGVKDPKQLSALKHIVSNLLGTKEMYIEIGPEFPLSKKRYCPSMFRRPRRYHGYERYCQLDSHRHTGTSGQRITGKN